MAVKDQLIVRINTRDHREYATLDGDLVIARRQTIAGQPTSEWLVTAHSNDLGAQVQGLVGFNEAGFRGRQWESSIDGQQYPSLIEAMRAAISVATRQADIAAFVRVETEGRVSGGAYHCPCGWSRVILDSETPADARRAHEGADIHALALRGEA
jgi:hypothetical protein